MAAPTSNIQARLPCRRPQRPVEPWLGARKAMRMAEPSQGRGRPPRRRSGTGGEAPSTPGSSRDRGRADEEQLAPPHHADGTGGGGVRHSTALGQAPGRRRVVPSLTRRAPPAATPDGTAPRWPGPGVQRRRRLGRKQKNIHLVDGCQLTRKTWSSASPRTCGVASTSARPPARCR